MTGQYPFRAQPGTWRSRATIDSSQLTLAGFLKQHGYHTAMVGKWHLGFDEKGYDRRLGGGPIDLVDRTRVPYDEIARFGTKLKHLRILLQKSFGELKPMSFPQIPRRREAPTTHPPSLLPECY